MTTETTVMGSKQKLPHPTHAQVTESNSSNSSQVVQDERKDDQHLVNKEEFCYKRKKQTIESFKKQTTAAKLLAENNAGIPSDKTTT